MRAWKAEVELSGKPLRKMIEWERLNDFIPVVVRSNWWRGTEQASRSAEM